MTKLSEEFVAKLALSDATKRCRESILSAGWSVTANGQDRIVASIASGIARNPSTVEVRLEEAGPTLTSVSLDGQIFGAGPLQKKYLKDSMTTLRRAMDGRDRVVPPIAVKGTPVGSTTPIAFRSPSFSISPLTITQARLLVVAGAACSVAAWLLVPWFSAAGTSFKAPDLFQGNTFIAAAGLYAPILVGLGALAGDRFAGTWKGLFMFASAGPLYVGILYSFFKVPASLQGFAITVQASSPSRLASIHRPITPEPSAPVMKMTS